MFPRLFVWRASTLAWAIQIYRMSASPDLSSDHTRSWLAEFLQRWFRMQPPESTVLWIGFVIRKSAHATEYAVLAFLVFQSLEGLLEGRLRRVGCSFAIAAVYALSDEFHQRFVPGRGASLVDWGIDLAGALGMALLIHTHRAGAGRPQLSQ